MNFILFREGLPTRLFSQRVMVNPRLVQLGKTPCQAPSLLSQGQGPGGSSGGCWGVTLLLRAPPPHCALTAVSVHLC